jgi:hypothetical protein
MWKVPTLYGRTEARTWIMLPVVVAVLVAVLVAVASVVAPA